MSSLAKQRVPLNCKTLVQVNGRPLELVQPEALSFKLQEPILLLGKDRLVEMHHYENCLVVMSFIFTDLFRTYMLPMNI